jgi:hypothetical protein
MNDSVMIRDIIDKYESIKKITKFHDFSSKYVFCNEPFLFSLFISSILILI